MNNNTPAILRSLIIYALVVPLAVWMGYLLAAPADRGTFGIGGILALILCSPILLRWHHLLLVASLNFGLMVFFLPGSPQVWLPMVALSLGLSVLHRAVNSEARFISAPLVSWPLIFLIAVVVFTAQMTGGLGLKSMGSETVGGKRYVWLFVAILGYFAITARRIPPKRAGLYLGLYFCGTCSGIIGDLAGVMPSGLSVIYAFFPASGYASLTGQPGSDMNLSRYAGLGFAGLNITLFMMARYGLRGIFLAGRPGRLFVFALFSFTIPLGGFRTFLIIYGLVFALMFFMERLQRTRIFPVFIFAGIIVSVLCVAFANKLPNSVQRTLAFLPLKIDPAIRRDAQDSSDWRVQLWMAVLPQVPQYLLLGKGYSQSAADYALMDSGSTFGNQPGSADSAVAVSGNYHNGPLSVLIFFGLWGAVGVIWFWSASLHALYNNYRYGDPALQTVNTLLLVLFIVKILIFLIIFGSLFSDMMGFTGCIGLSISLNGGIRRRAATVKAVPHARVSPLARPPFQPAFPR